MIRLISILIVAAQITILVLYCAIPFWLGYHGVILDDVFLVECLLTIFCFLFVIAVMVLIFSLIKKRYQSWPLLSMFAVLFAFFLFRKMPNPEIDWTYGIKSRVLNDYTLDDLRRFANEIKAAGIVREGGGDFNGWNCVNASLNDAQKRTIDDLTKKYYFLCGHADGPSILTYPDEVTFQWGGGESEAPWCGCSIALNGKRKSSIDARLTLLPVSDDIIFYYSLPD